MQTIDPADLTECLICLAVVRTDYLHHHQLWHERLQELVRDSGV